MDELAARCARFSTVLRPPYTNTYDRPSRSLGAALDWSSAARIRSEWEALRPDVLHVNKQNLEDGLELLGAASAARSIPSICTIHLTQSAQYLDAKAHRLRDWVARRSLARYRGTLVAVQAAREASLRAFVGPSARTATVLNGVPAVDSSLAREARLSKRAELGVSPDDLLVLGLGRLVAQKRPDRFLQAAKALHARLPNARFVWVGDGDFAPQWQSWVAANRMEGVVSLAGWQRETFPYVAASDLLLHVAEFEGFPLAIAESMMAGLPCAVSSGFANEIPQLSPENVLYADDPAALAARLADRESTRRIAANARAFARRELSLDAMARAYETLYLSAREPRNRPV